MSPVPSWPKRIVTSPLLWLTIACLACLLPFLDKAFHIDDTLFLYAAKHIQEDPVSFYRFAVNWYGTADPMWEVMQNPPLASYYIALVAAIFGWSEPALHFAFLLPAVAAIWGTYRLAEQFCTRPLLASLATLLTPAFLVSSTNVMCDTMTLCFWVWAVVFWERGLRRRQMVLLILSALLICLAALTKYIGVALIPLLLVYTVVQQRGRGNPLTSMVIPCVALGIPVVVLAMYQQLTEEMYGHGLLFQAAGYSMAVRHPLQGIFLKVVVGLGFLGGSAATLIFFLPLLWSWRGLLIGFVLTAGLTMAAGLSLNPKEGYSWIFILQRFTFIAAGTSLLALTCLDMWKRRDAASLLLTLWVGGILVFAAFLNWTINVRSLLPLLPAVGILIARRLDQRFGPVQAMRRGHLLCALVPAAILALMVTWADYRMANSVRTAAARIVAASANHPGTRWHQGHWGFQYYMGVAGVVPVDFYQFEGKAGDLAIYPGNNSNVEPDKPSVPLPNVKPEEQPPWPRVEPELYSLNVVPCRWLATMDPSVGAGFYAEVWGPLPFAFGKVRPAHFSVVELAPISRRKASR